MLTLIINNKPFSASLIKKKIKKIYILKNKIKLPQQQEQPPSVPPVPINPPIINRTIINGTILLPMFN